MKIFKSIWRKATQKLPENGKRYICCEEGDDTWFEAYWYEAGSIFYDEEKEKAYRKAHPDMTAEERLLFSVIGNDECKTALPLTGWYYLDANKSGFMIYRPLHHTGAVNKVWYRDIRVPRKVFGKAK